MLTMRDRSEPRFGVSQTRAASIIVDLESILGKLEEKAGHGLNMNLRRCATAHRSPKIIWWT